MSDKKLSRVEVDALSKEDLAKYASDAFGISLDPSKKKREMLDAFEKAAGQEAYGADEPEDGAHDDAENNVGEIRSESGDARGEKTDEPDKATKPRLDHSDPSKHPRHTIMIQASDRPGGGDPVAVNVNGKAILIHRGVKVSVPEPYLRALENAVETIHETKTEGSKIIKTPRDVLSYPFQDFGPTVEGDGAYIPPAAGPYVQGRRLRRG